MTKFHIDYCPRFSRPPSEFLQVMDFYGLKYNSQTDKGEIWTVEELSENARFRMFRKIENLEMYITEIPGPGTALFRRAL